MRSLLVGGAWLVFVWVALTGNPSPLSLLVGSGAAITLLVFFRPTYTDRARLSFRLWPVLSFLVFFNLRFVVATLQVAMAVLAPERYRRQPALIAVPIAASTEVTTTLLANAISLTPGTCFIEMHRDPAVMYVHVLQLRSLTAQRLEILDLERRIVRAFGPWSGVETVAALMARVTAEGDG
jgi:multicomponent Na+:H+ antiporter subunit E